VKANARPLPEVPPETQTAFAIVLASVAGGIGAAWIVPHLISWIPYDYSVYMQGARMVRAGIDPYAVLSYWYPLPIVLFTTLPWSFLPDQFAWAFAFIPLGLLHLRYGKQAIFWWLFFPLLIGVAYAQAEGWLILPLFWILEDAPIKAPFGIIALMFKPAYGMFLVPYRLWQWLRDRRWKDLAWLAGLAGVTFGAAFLADPMWLAHWVSAILRRPANAALAERNMTVGAFLNHGELGLMVLVVLLVILAWLSVPLLRAANSRADLLLALSLFFFLPGLNPVSSMMVLPLAKTVDEILTLVVVSWFAAGIDTAVGGFGGAYLVIVLAALALRVRRQRIGAVSN